MAQIAYADGEIDETELELLKRYIRKMDFADENTDGITEFLLDAAKEHQSVESIIRMITNIQ